MLYLSNKNYVECIDGRVGRGGVPALVVDYLVVGGGGAGGFAVLNQGYQGGGAGGFVTGSLTLSFNTPFDVIVGAGGSITGSQNGFTSSFSGNNFGTPITLIGAGGLSGQSGSNSGLPQAFGGGTGSECNGAGRYFGAGGGGGMRAGYDAVCFPTNAAGGGGDALAWYSGSFAGGGGGGLVALAGETPGAGGGGSSTNGRSGGDGASFTQPGVPPVQNTGGGGGAAGNNNLYPPTNGASGSVIIRYPYIPADFGIPYATGGDKYIFNGYVYHRFNNNGTFTTFAR